MSHHNMLYKYSNRTRNSLGYFYLLIFFSFLYAEGVFNYINIPITLVGYEMINAESALHVSLAIYDNM